MKELQNVLNIVSDGLKTLAKGVEAIAEKVDEVAKPQSPVKPKRKKVSKAATKAKTGKKPARAAAVKAAKKPAQKAAKKKAAGTATDTDKVLEIIGRSKKGVSTATITGKTGFNQKKVANIVYRLRKQGKIDSVEKGVYTKS
jgi:hypothetical protein